MTGVVGQSALLLVEVALANGRVASNDQLTMVGRCVCLCLSLESATWTVVTKIAGFQTGVDGVLAPNLALASRLGYQDHRREQSRSQSQQSALDFVLSPTQRCATKNKFATISFAPRILNVWPIWTSWWFKMAVGLCGIVGEAVNS